MLTATEIRKPEDPGGKLPEIEKNLTEKYDYITLIGVFEYGEAYIQSETPYVDFLEDHCHTSETGRKDRSCH